MENFPFRLFCDSFQKALSRVLEAPDPESNEDAANCHRLRDLFFSKTFVSVVHYILTIVTDSKNIFLLTQSKHLKYWDPRNLPGGTVLRPHNPIYDRPRQK